MKLNYLPKEDPKGKQKVFFTCHPDDVKYFENIKEDILSCQNVAIWFKEDPSEEFASEQEMREVLFEEMNLIVIPVTSNLLLRPNAAMDVEFPYAKQNGIPVLPLMMEAGLEELYAQKFQDWHFLQPVQTDSTAIPYEEKLKRFLESVLVGDEMIEQIQNAFDAYIFMSYRKKDRKYALDLMRMIHRVPGYRNFAIWYDEYLVPGENFREAIRDAMEKSDLFTMIVTPNLIREENYVKTEEFPMAKEEPAPYPILPVEMEDTDDEELKRQFKQIPDVISGKEGVAFTDAFLDTLKKIAIRENEGSQEHNFLIGLAYLNGIDVEKEPERAVKLIEGAAEAGIPEAMSQMAVMYHDGIGVKRDYNKSIEWRERKVEKLRSGGDEDLLCEELMGLGDEYRENKNLEKAESAYQETIPYYSKEKREAELSVIYARLGDVAEARGDLSGAEDWYKRALLIDERLAPGYETEIGKRNLSIGYCRLGDIVRSNGKTEDAEDWYKRALLFSEALVQEKETAETKWDLALNYIRVGDCRKDRNMLEEAETWCLKALEILKELARANKPSQAKNSLAVCCSRLGTIHYESRNFEKAEEWFQKAAEIYEELDTENESMESKTALATGYGNIGAVAFAQGKLADAEHWYLSCEKALTELSEFSEAVDIKGHLAKSYRGLSDIELEKENLEGSIAWLRKEVEVLGEINEVSEVAETKNQYIESLSLLGSMVRNKGDLEEAEETCRKLIEVLSRQMEVSGETQLPKLDFASANYNLGIVLLDRGKLPEAEKAFREGLEVAANLTQDYMTKEAKEIKQLTANFYDRLAYIEGTKDNLEEAKRYYYKGQDIRAELENESK